MSYVVMITTRDRGDIVRKEDRVWCYVHSSSGSSVTLCTNEVFGYGEGGAEYKTKDGKITCPDCLAIIKKIKAIKL